MTASEKKRISDAIWLAIIAGIVSVAVGVIPSCINLRTQTIISQIGQKADITAVAIKDSTINNGEKLNDIKEVSTETRRLVDGGMTIQLKMNAAVTKRLALLTKDPEDVAAADWAATMLREHEKAVEAAEKESE